MICSVCEGLAFPKYLIDIPQPIGLALVLCELLILYSTHKEMNEDTTDH